MDNNRILNLPTSIGFNQPATKLYTDTHFLNVNGQTPMSGRLDMKNKKKTVGLATPEGDNDAATKKYVDDNKPDLSNYLKLDGEKTMKGILNMDSHKITNVYMDYTSGTDSGRKYWKNKEFQKKD